MGDDLGPEEPLLRNHRQENLERYHVDGTPSGDDAGTDSTTNLLDPEIQDGIQQAEAINLVWTRTALVLTYSFIFINFCLNSMQEQVSVNLMPYVVSNFSSHSLIPAIAIASYVLSGVLKLPIAKMIDTWGRPQGFLVMTGLATLGLFLMATCRDIQTYAVARILHGVGFNGFAYILDIIIADTSSLKDRAMAFAFVGSPYLATTFIGPRVAQWFLRYSSWRIAFALFVVLTPLVAAPVFIVLELNTRKAERLGVLKKSKSTRTWSESLWHYAVEFDGKGVFFSFFSSSFYCHTCLSTSNHRIIYELTVFIFPSYWCHPCRRRLDVISPTLFYRWISR